MPLDRRITIQRNHGTHVEGVFVNDWRDVATVWADRRDLDSTDIADIGGSISITTRRWRIRYRADLEDVDTTLYRVVDGSLMFNFSKLIELTGRDFRDRRRWMQIEGIAIP